MTIRGNFPIPDLFNRFLKDREHIVLVVDEFGGMSGIVTMEDVIETLLGLEIVDESDRVADIRALARKDWEKRAKSMGLLDAPSTQPSGKRWWKTKLMGAPVSSKTSRTTRHGCRLNFLPLVNIAYC